MKLKSAEAAELFGTIARLRAEKVSLGLRGGMVAAMAYKKLQPYVEAFGDQSNDVAKAHAKKDAEGNPVRPEGNANGIVLDDREGYEKAMREIGAVEIDVSLTTLTTKDLPETLDVDFIAGLAPLISDFEEAAQAA